MSEKMIALENLVENYLDRKREQDKVEAKYARYKQELAEAKAQDNQRVAEALAAAWLAGVKVAETGRAIGTSNIYTARREIYDLAREIFLGKKEEDREYLENLYRRVRGEEDVLKRSEFVERRTKGELVESSEENYVEGDEAWVASWTLTKIDDDTWSVDDPQERVASINVGKISGFPGANLGEFLQNEELHEMLYRIHPEVKPND